jgi:hypothetical protein
MPTGGTQAIAGSASGTNYLAIFTSTSDGGPVSTFFIANRSTSAGPAYVYISGLHDSTHPLPLYIGIGGVFRYGTPGVYLNITSVQVKGDGINAATVDYGVLAK